MKKNTPKAVKTIFALICTLIALSGCDNTSDKNNSADAEPREQALNILRHSLQTQQGWVKVHAAEYLLALGYPQDLESIRQIFVDQQETAGTEPQYRIGIWRTLAQCYQRPDQRQIYIDKILEAFMDKDGPDVLHATETLAKLKIRLNDRQLTRAQSLYNSDDITQSAFTAWLLAIQDKTYTTKMLLREILTRNPTRMNIASYAVSFHKIKFGTAQWSELAEVIFTTDMDQKVRANLLAAALVCCPLADDLRYWQFYDELLEMATVPDKNIRRTVCIALALMDSVCETDVIRKLRDDKFPLITEQGEIDNPTNADVRLTAAWAQLCQLRKGHYGFRWLDWVVLAGYCLIMLVVGWLCSVRNKNSEDFLLGGRAMNPFMVGLSFFATMLSALSYLAYPGEAIKNGPVLFIGLAAFPAIYFIVGWFLIPKFMKSNVTSAYELLEIKLGTPVRMLATFFFLSLRFLWMATIIFITVDTAIIGIFGVDRSYIPLICAAMGGLTILYTSIGGLKAVVITDVIQTIILLGGALLTLVLITISFGSVSAWMPQTWPENWPQLDWSINLGGRTVLNMIIYIFSWHVFTAGSDQMAIQRYLATKDVKAARKTFAVSAVTTIIVQILLMFVGIAVLAYFQAHPYLLAAGTNTYDNADTLFPRFIVVGLPIGLTGLVTAGLLAAAMSSLSSGLSSSASVVAEDIIKRFGKTRKEASLSKVQLISFTIGALSMACSFLVGNVQGNVIEVVIKVVNLFVAPLFVLFFMALFVKKATVTGTLAGGLTSVAVAVSIGFYNILGIGVFWLMPVAFIVGVVTATLISTITNTNKETQK